MFVEKKASRIGQKQNLVNLRHVLYLAIMKTSNYEEAIDKLLKIELEEVQDVHNFFEFVA